MHGDGVRSSQWVPLVYVTVNMRAQGWEFEARVIELLNTFHKGNICCNLTPLLSSLLISARVSSALCSAL